VRRGPDTSVLKVTLLLRKFIIYFVLSTYVNTLTSQGLQSLTLGPKRIQLCGLDLTQKYAGHFDLKQREITSTVVCSVVI